MNLERITHPGSCHLPVKLARVLCFPFGIVIPAAAGQMDSGRESVPIIAGCEFGYPPFCWSFAVPEGHKDLLALLNEGLALVIADGTSRRFHAKHGTGGGTDTPAFFV